MKTSNGSRSLDQAVNPVSDILKYFMRREQVQKNFPKTEMYSYNLPTISANWKCNNNFCIVRYNRGIWGKQNVRNNSYHHCNGRETNRNRFAVTRELGKSRFIQKCFHSMFIPKHGWVLCLLVFGLHLCLGFIQQAIPDRRREEGRNNGIGSVRLRHNFFLTTQEGEIKYGKN